MWFPPLILSLCAQRPNSRSVRRKSPKICLTPRRERVSTSIYLPNASHSLEAALHLERPQPALNCDFQWIPPTLYPPDDLFRRRPDLRYVHLGWRCYFLVVFPAWAPLAVNCNLLFLEFIRSVIVPCAQMTIRKAFYFKTIYVNCLICFVLCLGVLQMQIFEYFPLQLA